MMYEQRRGRKPGTILANRYRLDARIGAGGFAITYKGVNLDNNVAVAVKEFCPLDGSAGTEREKRRFIREASILREFDYLQGIVSVRDVFEEGGTAWLVMDYIEGITFKDYVREYGVFSWDELVGLLAPVMRSLTKIHRREVAHCDISPDNLILGMDNQLWLIDFGATQCQDTEHERTVIVKQGYAPLEQYYSDGSSSDGKIGSWTDVYALAATMYMGLTGDKPRSSVERLKDGKASDEERRALQGILEDWQTEVLLKAMAVHKSERYAAMDEFLEAVSFAPEDRVTKVISPEMTERKLKRSIRGLLALLAALVLVLFGLVTYIVFGSGVSGSRRQMGHTVSGDDGELAGQQPEETGAAEKRALHAEDSRTEQETKAETEAGQDGTQAGDATQTGQGETQTTEADEAGRSGTQATEAGEAGRSGTQTTEVDKAGQSGTQAGEAGGAGQSGDQTTETGGTGQSGTKKTEAGGAEQGETRTTEAGGAGQSGTQTTGGTKAKQQAPDSSQESAGTTDQTAPTTDSAQPSPQPGASQTDTGQSGAQTDAGTAAGESGSTDDWQGGDDDDDLY